MLYKPFIGKNGIDIGFLPSRADFVKAHLKAEQHGAVYVLISQFAELFNTGKVAGRFYIICTC